MIHNAEHNPKMITQSQPVDQGLATNTAAKIGRTPRIV